MMKEVLPRDLSLLVKGIRHVRAGDHDTARTVFLPLAKQGNVEACYELGMLYRSEKSSFQSKAEAIKWFEKASAKNHAEATTCLGAMYARGEGVPENNDKANELYWKAAALGSTIARCNLGAKFREGVDGFPKDYDKAYWLLIAGARSKMNTPTRNLATMYLFGQGVEKNYKIAAPLLKISANLDDYLGCYYLGMLYYNGWGVPRDKDEALYCFRQAASHGHEKSIKMILDITGEKYW